MHLFIMCFFLCSISMTFAHLMKYRFEQTVSITCFTTIAILYIGGLLGMLEIGVYLCISMAIGSLIYLVFGFIKGFIKKDFIMSNILTPGFAVFFFFYIFICLVHRDRLLYLWDEFSHWGLVVKNMYILDAFGTHPDSNVLYRGYPPGTAVFQYFWMKISGFNESNLYRAMNVLVFSLILPVFKKIEWKSKGFIFAAFGIFFLLPFSFYPIFYSEIYVDAILGVLFAYILFLHFTEENYTVSTIINLSLSLFVLTLTKASGFGLAIIAALIITVDFAYRKQFSFCKEENSGNKTFRDRCYSILSSKYLHVLGAIYLVPVLTNYSWSLHRKLTSTGYAWGRISNLTVPAIVSFFKGGGAPYQYTTMKNFVHAIVSDPVSSLGIKLTYLQCVLMTAIVMCIWYCKSNEDFRKKLRVISVGLFLGGGLYVSTLAVLYAFTYSEYEAVRLASFERYMNTYLFAIVLFLICIFIDRISSYNRLPKYKRAFLISLVLVPLLLLTNYLYVFGFLAGLLGTPLPEHRKDIEISKILSLPLDYRVDKTAYIYQGSVGFQRGIARYEIAPLEIVGKFSLGTPYSEMDEQNGYTDDISCEEWLEKLKSYDCTYVYLEYIDEQFFERYAEAFEDKESIKNHSLYSIQEKDNRIFLKYVELP